MALQKSYDFCYAILHSPVTVLRRPEPLRGCRPSILSPSIGAHLDDARIEPSDNFDEVLLRGHHFQDVLVDVGDFICTGRDDMDIAPREVFLYGAEVVLLFRRRATHPASGSVCGRHQAVGVPLAAHDERGVGHRTGNHAEHARSGGSRSLAMHDHVATAVRFFPRKVVMVLDSRDDLCADQLRHQTMDDVVIGRRVVAHQVHRRPVFLTGLIVETQPRQAADIGVSLRQQVASDVMIIEDEPIIAMDLEALLESLGHTVTGIARTEKEALHLASTKRPKLILADIQLADGSSGIDAVNKILLNFSVPVIFITAFPERLLTGEKPEPVFLITKPFMPEMVKAMVSQALFFDIKSEIAA